MTSNVRVRSKPLELPKSIKITVGILDEGKTYETGLTVKQVAENHEFGYGVPVRSWLRGWFDEQNKAVEGEARTLLEGAYEDGSWEQAAGLLALQCETRIKTRIEEGGVFVALSPKTEAKKRAKGWPPPYTILVEYGFLLNSIVATSEVTR